MTVLPAEVVAFGSRIGRIVKVYETFSDLLQAGDTFVEGQNMRVGRYLYRAAAAGANDHNVVFNGSKLYIESFLPGYYPLDAFNAAGDDATDDRDVLLAALAGIPEYSILWCSPNKTYRISDEINLKKSVHILGSCSGRPGAGGTTFHFDDGVAGFIVNRSNTYSDGLDGGEFGGGDAGHTILEGLRIEGGGARIADTKSGVRLRARTQIRRCYILGFPSHGIHVLATAGSGTPFNEGNANYFTIDTVSCRYNKEWGILVNGADANAGVLRQIDAVYNGYGGEWDSSFLGNGHEYGHTAFNGLQNSSGNAAGQSGHVSHNGRRYSAQIGATAQELVDTEPGTNGNIWIDDGPGNDGTAIPLWQAAQPAGTYLFTRAYYSDNPNAKGVWLSMYSEGGQAGSDFASREVVLGGLHGATVYSGAELEADNKSLRAKKITGGSGTGDGTASLGGGYHFTYTHTDTGDDIRLKSLTGHFEVDVNNLGSQTVEWQSLGDGDTDALLSHRRGFNGAMFGSYSNHFAVVARQSNLPPQTGETLKAGIEYRYTRPSAGGSRGFYVTVGGEVGVDARWCMLYDMGPELSVGA